MGSIGHNSRKNNRWAIVLAAGDGTRLRSLTTDVSGIAVPKQFCSFRRPYSMLHDALNRAESLVSKDRIVTVVASRHRRWWEPELREYPQENVVLQPENKGTAAGLLLPLIEILRRDPDAEVLVLPSDHYVADESVLKMAFLAAIPAAHEAFQRVVLLGITPDQPDTEYGWIVPMPRGKEFICGVERFVEKPELGIANRLFREGGLWNSFMFAASGKTLLYLFQEILPDLLSPFLQRLFDAAPRWNALTLAELYQKLPNYDFSRHLLEKASQHLGVLPVPPCGWSDLGTPERVRCCIAESNGDWEIDLYSKFEGRLLALPSEGGTGKSFE